MIKLIPEVKLKDMHLRFFSSRIIEISEKDSTAEKRFGCCLS